jgi:hypothetical protein
VGRPSDGFCIGSHRTDLDPAVLHVEAHTAAALAAHRLAHDRDRGGAERIARRDDVAFAHLDRARRHQLAEHAGTTGELGDEAPGLGPEGLETVDQQGHGGLRELGQLGGVVGETAGGQQNVRHRAGLLLGIVQHDGDAGPQSERDDDPVPALGGPVGHLHDDLFHAGFL